ncbi:MAG: hypothetical protein Q7S65_00490 [Nanoarchaeota archaeon]|nr:hypothetical protein [Nanoarchaeota archaeon]
MKINLKNPLFLLFYIFIMISIGLFMASIDLFIRAGLPGILSTLWSYALFWLMAVPVLILPATLFVYAAQMFLTVHQPLRRFRYDWTVLGISIVVAILLEQVAIQLLKVREISMSDSQGSLLFAALTTFFFAIVSLGCFVFKLKSKRNRQN